MAVSSFTRLSPLRAAQVTAVGVFVIVGAGNAVNLTDGLDGLAIVPVMIAAASAIDVAALAGRPTSVASTNSPPMIAARTTVGDAPVSTV